MAAPCRGKMHIEGNHVKSGKPGVAIPLFRLHIAVISAVPCSRMDSFVSE